LNKDKEIFWNKSYSTGAGFHVQSSGMILSDDNSLIVLHPIYFSHGSGVLKIDSTGQIIFSKGIFLYGLDLFETNNKEYFIIGNGPIQGEKQKSPKNEVGIIQLDSLGNGVSCVEQNQVSTTTSQIVSENLIITSGQTGYISTLQVETFDFELSTAERCVGFVGSIGHEVLNANIKIFPNPNEGYFEIQADMLMQEITIQNLLGNNVFESGKVIENRFVFSNKIPPGIYLITILFSDGIREVRKIIITD